MDEAVRRWAELTASCVELRRIGIRGEYPDASNELVEAKLQDEIRRARDRRTAAYDRDA